MSKADLKRVSLSLILLLAATLTLLLSDLKNRTGARSQSGPQVNRIQVGFLKHASNSLLDEVERGLVEELAEGNATAIDLQRFCAEGDLGTANMIAKRITDGTYPIVVSISTLSLQCVANANKDGRVNHVFAAVTDPAGAGVGIQMNSTNKPPWIAGIGTFQPVLQIFTEARKLWPGLKSVGVVWNPAERNSEACVLKARQVCQQLGLQLIEANVEQSKDVREAAESLVARGVEAFWTGFDVTVLNATSALCDVARKARLPVFSNNSGHIREGTLFDLGANYCEVGHRLGSILLAVAQGTKPSSLIITNFMPERVMLNKQALRGLRDPWRFTEDLATRAEVIMAENGQIEKELKTARIAGNAPQPVGARARKAPGPTRPWRVRELSYSESVMVEDAMRGFRAGLKEAALAEGSLTLEHLSAQGDMAALGSLFDSAQTAGVDLYVVYGTPTLQTAVRKAGSTPVVFTVVADPFVAGAGTSDTNHLPNITGVYTLGPYREMVDMLRTYFPGIRRVGTLFCPAEANSVANKDLFLREAHRAGLTVELVAANSASELPDAAMALGSRGLDAVVQVIDNLSASGFPAITRAAQQNRLPVFACQSAAAQHGAAVVLSRDYFEAGRETALKAVRILRGESPARIPFSPPSRTQTLINRSKAIEGRLIIPEALWKDAMEVGNSPVR